jgi:hypothetical protein
VWVVEVMGLKLFLRVNSGLSTAAGNSVKGAGEDCLGRGLCSGGVWFLRQQRREPPPPCHYFRKARRACQLGLEGEATRESAFPFTPVALSPRDLHDSIFP